MKIIEQRKKSDCGVACLAMIGFVTYEEAEQAIEWRREGMYRGVTAKQIRDGAYVLGWGTEQERLQVIQTPKAWVKLLQAMIADFWHLIPDHSLVKVPRPDDGEGWHWVVWKDHMVFDPAKKAPMIPTLYGIKPTSYAHFVQETDDG